MDAIVRVGSPEDAEKAWRLFQIHQNWANVWHDMHEVVQFRVTSQSFAHAMRVYPSAVAVADDDVIGFAISEAREIGVIELCNIYVDDPYRNQGIGGKLLQSLEEQCHQLGIAMMVGFSSERYYAGKRLPTGLFGRQGWEVKHLNPHTEMYIREIPLTPEEEQRVFPPKGVGFVRLDDGNFVTIEDIGKSEIDSGQRSARYDIQVNIPEDQTS